MALALGRVLHTARSADGERLSLGADELGDLKQMATDQGQSNPALTLSVMHGGRHNSGSLVTMAEPFINGHSFRAFPEAQLLLHAIAAGEFGHRFLPQIAAFGQAHPTGQAKFEGVCVPTQFTRSWPTPFDSPAFQVFLIVSF